MPALPGCKCRHCYTLTEYMEGLTGKSYGLPPAPGHTHLVPVPQHPDEPVCTQALDCQCKTCTIERARHLQNVRRLNDNERQPWDVRPARQRKAA